ncbi:hypothetical protein [Oceanithermus desulfurans]|uniref:Lipoprotein n=2 Tax=Oceanithermus desulfurans TaxID=227924 RepID=A0A511RIH7_9DEIN|nr:hypothetical protein [Oceanithermus desulfurans]MBB6030089.1 hypothetical protein [Oceanithermus desulfurans]GEM88646.1 hypothetical protein ODE01S_00800 [Oceanithermus desulfurans NBRC 100063]
MKRYFGMMALLVLVLAACSTTGTLGDGQSLDAEQLAIETDLNLDAAIFEDLGGAAAASVQSVEDQDVADLAGAWGLPTVAVRFLKAWGVRLPRPGDADGQCSIEVNTNGYADVDGDGVFDLVDATFDCSGTMGDGQSFAVSGAFHFEDKDGAFTGFAMTLSDFTVSLTNVRGEHTVQRTRTLNGSVDVSGSPAEGYVLTKDLSIDFVVAVDGEVLHEAAWTSQKTKTYTPDDPDAPAAGGVVSISGNASLTRDGNTMEFQVSTSTDVEGETPLHWSRDCWRAARDAGRLGHKMGGFDAGWILHENLTNGNYTKITYNGCGDVSIEKSF